MSIKKEHIYFLKIISVSIFIILFILSFLFWIISGGLEKISPNLPVYIFLFLDAALLLIIFIFLLGLFKKHGKNKSLLVYPSRYILIKILYPMAFFITSIFRINRDKMQNSFIDINNFLLFSMNKQVSLDRILILLPHCLQLHNCKAKITDDIHNCLSCGKCNIKELAILADKKGMFIAVATGGTLARMVLEEKRPQAVIAVACERDLSSGIIDGFPLPVYGLSNMRPNGPCRDTFVDISALSELIGRIALSP
ncbi:DUF116 domain-containing protein [Candidatus Acidulodesulfobacterium sp. H_13]|uniref:DUF116 domain-containing protein n=1 Tax=Candidatus Acidulodesulfobacterium sp. H_13 TaxID=3395470 RepID=UPI003AF66598